MNYLVICGDDFSKFEDEIDAEDYINELLEEEDVLPEDIEVYKVEQIQLVPKHQVEYRLSNEDDEPRHKKPKNRTMSFNEEYQMLYAEKKTASPDRRVAIDNRLGQMREQWEGDNRATRDWDAFAEMLSYARDCEESVVSHD